MPIQNPAAGLRIVISRENRGARVLADGELKFALGPSRTCPAASPPISQSTRLLPCSFARSTLQRAGEVSGTHQSQSRSRSSPMDVIPASRAKNKREHVVPLSADAKRIVESAIELAHGQCRNRLGKDVPTDLAAGLVFPSPCNHERAITRRAVTRAMARVCDKLNIKDASPHDLRRTGATAITSERIGMPRFLLSQLFLATLVKPAGRSVYDSKRIP